MPDGYLVTLGDNTIDPGDSVAPTGPSPFGGETFLGRGSVNWTNGGNSGTSSGDFFLADNGSVYFVPDFPPSSGAQGGTASVQSYSGSQPPAPCFLSGTLIDTPDGPTPIERLQVGQRVIVRGGLPQPILWIGQREIGHASVQSLTDVLPLELKFKELGSNLIVPPQHAIYVDFDSGGMLVRAVQLLRLRRLGARQMRGLRSVCYYHLLLPRHHLIRANGIWSESLYPGARACAAFSKDQIDALRKCDISEYGPSAAPYAKLKDIRDVPRKDWAVSLVKTNTGYSSVTTIGRTQIKII